MEGSDVARHMCGIIGAYIITNGSRLPYVAVMLAQRRRRWANAK